MLLTMLVVAGFQAWWLSSSYKDEVRLLTKETSVLLRETAFELQFGQLLVSDGVHGHGPDVLLFEDHAQHFEKRTTTITDSSSFETQVYVSVVTKDDSLRKARGTAGAAFMRTEGAPPPVIKERQLQVKGVNKEGETFTKKLVIRHVDQDDLKARFSARLHESGLPLPVYIFSTSFEDTLKRVPGLLYTTPVPSGVHGAGLYQVGLSDYTPVVLRRLLPQFLLSLCIVLITVCSFLLLYRNLLAQKRLAEQKTQFISNITHELKTPIATVSVALEALQNFNAMDDPARTREYLDISQKELQRLSLLVDKVLKLSMFESEKLELNLETIDLDALVKEVSGSMKLQLEKSRATLDYQTEGNDFRLHADRLHLVSVLFNLLDNALKYGGEHPQIGIALKEENAQLVLRVRDSGLGIPEEYKEKIFEKFFRVPQGDRHNVKGYGLGLSYVAGIVRKHGGTIAVESERGKGSEFIIRFPKKS